MTSYYSPQQSQPDIQFTYAGFWRRFWAYFIDGIPIGLIVFAVAYFFFGFDQVIHEYFTAPKTLENRIKWSEAKTSNNFAALLIWIIYSTFMDASAYQGTFGKRLLGIHVVDKYGRRLSLGRSAARNFSKFLSYYAIFIGFIWVAFSKKKRGWHDMIAGSYVIRTNQ